MVTLPVGAEQTLPLLNAGGETYSNVTVLRVTATDVHFTHARGMANAKLKDLEPEMQRQFRYDPARAVEEQKKQIKANAQYRQEAAAKKTVRPAPGREAAMETVSTDDSEPVIRVSNVSARRFLNKPAPPLVVEKWLTDQPSTDGKFILIDFWATWCGPCRRSIPDLNALHAKYKDQMVFVGLSDESEQQVRAMRSPVIDYSVAIDTTRNMERAVGVTGIPHAMILDPDGIVRFEGHPGYLTDEGVGRLLAKYSR